MDIKITTKNFTITDAIKSYTEGKTDILIGKIKDPKVHAKLEFHNGLNIAELFVSSLEGDFKVECRDNESLYTAIECAFQKLEHQIDSFRKKRITERRNPSRNWTFEESEEEKKQPVNKIVKRKEFELKPMFEAEAIEMMNLIGHETFMFFNAEIELICLLYRRKDGNFGIIESTY